MTTGDSVAGMTFWAEIWAGARAKAGLNPRDAVSGRVAAKKRMRKEYR